jgi:hypothetical protein
MFKEKARQDKMLEEVKKKKIANATKEMRDESEYLDKLKHELDNETKEKTQKRLKEMKDAQKVIQENEVIRLKREKTKDEERLRD